MSTTRPDSVTGSARVETVFAVAAAGALVAFAGLPGLAAALAVLAAWYVLDSTFAFGLGQVGAATLVDDGGLVRLAVVEAALFGLLLSTLTATGDARRRLPVAIGWTAVWSLAAWAAATGTVGLPVVITTFVTATGLAAYALHRYQRVELASVTGEQPEVDA